MPGRRQCCLRVVQRSLRARNFGGRIAMLRALFRGIQAGLRGFQALSRRSYFARCEQRRSSQLGQRIQIVLRLVARQPILLDLRGGRLPLGLRAVVRGGIQRRLRRFHALSALATWARAARHPV